MIGKFLFGVAVFILAFGILSVSVLQSITVSYVFASPVPSDHIIFEGPQIDYKMPEAGRITSKNPIWFLKASRDRLLYSLSVEPLKKADLALLFADKRLVMAREFFEQKKPEAGFSTLSKGEKYLEKAVEQEQIARNQGNDTSIFLFKLASSSLKHRQIIEELLLMAPEDAKPEIIKVLDYSKNSYKYARDGLNSMGQESPKNPFDGTN